MFESPVWNNMHIPAMDSMRHERIGLIESSENTSMVTKMYVKTEETDEIGAHHPTEGFSRPFPYLAYSNQEVIPVEPTIMESSLEELPDYIVEYAGHLHESRMRGEWVDAVIEFDMESLNGKERMLCEGLFNFVSQEEPPQELQRLLYQNAHKFAYDESPDDSNSPLYNQPLRDIEGREYYNFEYLPSIEEVDSWSVKHTEMQVIDNGETLESESLWLQYENHNSIEERPLLCYQNGKCVYVGMSPNVSYGRDGMNDAPVEIVESILDSEKDEEINLSNVSPETFVGTRTLEYLENWIGV